jgi:ribosomal-protein-alanine N-acetyltransferase
MLSINFTPFPELTTERLILRPVELTDADDFVALRSHEAVNQFIDRPKSITRDEAISFIHKIRNGVAINRWVYWAISLKDSPKMVGTICLWNISLKDLTAETGYELHPDYQGKGIMREALSRVIDYGFRDMKLKAIEACTHRDNLRSTSLLERHHFRRSVTEVEGSRKEVLYILTVE